ncbi:MAG: putative membrane protein [Verrucomicrobiales bacterium]
MSAPLFTNDATVLGVLLLVLAAVFVTASSDHPAARRFYRFIPPLLLCYFIPALLHWPLGLIGGDATPLYNPLASRYLLPASLILLCISIDLKGLISLGPKSLVMFGAATVGIIVGGPVALLLVSTIAPDLLGADPANLWRGMSTLAGSWIGGGANQAAMKEIYQVSNEVFSALIIVDVVVANIWMGCLLYGAGCSAKIDKWLKADASAIDALKEKAESFQAKTARIPSVTDLFVLLAVAFGGTGLAHWGADHLTPWFEQMNQSTISAEHPAGSLVAWGLSSALSGFFWLIVLATTAGFALSFTRLRKLESVGASRVGSVFIYILVATIGMQMNLQEVFQNLGLFAVGIVWMLVHITVLLITAKLIRAPFFFVAVGSQANVGGAASAPVVASAFSPALAPVGALMAVLGYALGTYGAILCAELMRIASGF